MADVAPRGIVAGGHIEPWVAGAEVFVPPRIEISHEHAQAVRRMTEDEPLIVIGQHVVDDRAGRDQFLQGPGSFRRHAFGTAEFDHPVFTAILNGDPWSAGLRPARAVVQSKGQAQVPTLLRRVCHRIIPLGRGVLMCLIPGNSLFGSSFPFQKK